MVTVYVVRPNCLHKLHYRPLLSFHICSEYSEIYVSCGNIISLLSHCISICRLIHNIFALLLSPVKEAKRSFSLVSAANIYKSRHEFEHTNIHFSAEIENVVSLLRTLTINLTENSKWKQLMVR